METKMENYLTRSSQMDWKPLIEEHVDTNGIFVKILRFDEQEQRPPSFLLKLDPGAKYPYHNHPGGEEIFVLNGTCFINDQLLAAGDYLYTPPNFKHAVKTENGCELMLIVPQEVEILKG